MQLTIPSTHYIKDEYTGSKRIHIDEFGKKSEKEYITPVSGSIHRYSSKCTLGDTTDVWFEFKWTENVMRFEIEFEVKVPEEFKTRENIKGWYILKELYLANFRK